MVTLYLIRHAHSEWSQNEERPLSHEGQREAYRVRERLMDRPIAAVLSSPSKRALQTVEPLAETLRLHILVEEALRERVLSDKWLPNFEAAVAQTWREMDVALPGGETSAHARERGVTMVQQLMEKYQGDHVVVSTHGNLMALIMSHFEPRLGFDFWRSLSMPDIYQLRVGRRMTSVERIWIPL